MRLNETEAVLRPRSPWQAIDLGLNLAGRHRRLLLLSWACLTLPLLAVLSWLLWDYPTVVLLLLWWLKPALERLPLAILAQAWTGAPPTLTQALRDYPKQLRPSLWRALTWQRLSLSRSFTLPVSQLEGLHGAARQRRITLLRKDNSGAARWLTVFFVPLEYLFWWALMAGVWLLHPPLFDGHWQLEDPMALTANLRSAWPQHLANLAYTLVLMVTEPLYVACGFSLYLNRRCILEAWDIEQVLRRLAKRLLPVTAVLLVGVLATWPAPCAWAVPAPESPRLLNQPLDSEASRNQVQAILQQPPFRQQSTEKHWRWVRNDAEQAPTVALPSLPSLRLEGLAKAMETLLWLMVLGGAGVLAWRYRHWAAQWRGADSVQSLAPAPDTQVAQVRVRAGELPANIADSAERIWPDQPREALGLLYRGLLQRLLVEYHLPLTAADTETEVLTRIEELGRPDLSAFARHLTCHWQNLAYGHRPPPLSAGVALCSTWRELFEPAPLDVQP